MKVCKLSTTWNCYLRCQIHIGIFTSYRRSRSEGSGSHSTCILRILLHCPSKCYRLTVSCGAPRCAEQVSSIPHFLSRDCSAHWLLSSPTTFLGSLFLTHSCLWCPKWALFFYHRIQAYCSSQETLATLEQIQGTRPDVANKPTPW